MTPGKKFLSSDEIRPLAERSDLWGFLLLAHCWAVIIAPLMVFSLWPSVFTAALAVIIIGSRQLGVAILMHEAAHNALFRSAKLNTILGAWLCGNPILADLSAYRTYHLKHHRHTQTKDDPDLRLSRPFPATRASMMRKLLRDISGITGIKQRTRQFMVALKLAGDLEHTPSEEELAQAFSGTKLKHAVLVNLVIFGFMWAFGAWWWWFAFWALPLLTWYQLVLRVRNIAEHGVVEFSENPLRNVRTTKAGPLMRLLLAPYWVNFHLEHHLVMHVPCRNLPKLHRLMLEKGHGPDMEIAQNYWDVLTRVASKPA